MGLFGNLKDGMKSAVQKTVDEKMDAGRARMESSTVGRMALGAMDAAKRPKMATMSVSPWNVQPPTRTYRLPADHEATIYTYNGEPLRGIAPGTRFVIRAVPADVVMESAYTDYVASTTDYGNIAYEYNGQIFGMGKSHAEAIERLMRNGYAVEVEAYISGFDGERGFPYVKGLFGFVDDAIYMELGR